MAKMHVFIAHSKDDKKLKDDLLKHLSSQKEDGKASFWDRDAILPGEDEDVVIAAELSKADIILLLLTADFFNLKACRDLEREAFALKRTKNVALVPIMLRYFDLGASYDGLATLPRRDRPILGRYWDSEDEAFTTVATKIGDIIAAKARGDVIPHLKPPPLVKKIARKLKRPAGIGVYLLLVLLLFSTLFLPKRNLPVKMKLAVNQVDFRLIENLGNGFWSQSIFAKNAMVKNFTTATLPGRNLRLLDNPDQLLEIPESRIKIDRLSATVDPYLYLFDVYLSDWDISDSATIRLRMTPENSLFISVDQGRSKGTFNFNDSLEFYTESSSMKFGGTKYEDDMEAILYSSAGRVNFEAVGLDHSISLDSLTEGLNTTNLYVSELKFQKDLRTDKGTVQSSILSGEITIDGFDPITIDTPEAYFLKFESPEPLRIQNINVLGENMELLIIGEGIKDIKKGTSLATMKSEIPTILEWLMTKYQLGLLATLVAFLLPLITFGINLFKKRAS